ncbi:MAG TPA: peptidylprolyl isomerase, partial [Candidatus Baltobacteraceae bacterium]|nr:peptidylprolyl isomerase [Candidatus Baltobacteraceae bacterium]
MIRSLIVGAVALALVACSGAKQQTTQSPQAGGAQTFRVAFDTSRGPFVVEVDPALAPNGAARFAELVKAKYFDGARFYRVVPNFVVQWGAAANPKVTKKWDVPIPDDPVKTSNVRGTITFA